MERAGVWVKCGKRYDEGSVGIDEVWVQCTLSCDLSIQCREK